MLKDLTEEQLISYVQEPRPIEIPMSKSMDRIGGYGLSSRQQAERGILPLTEAEKLAKETIVPSYMILGEIERRKANEAKAQAQEADKPPIAEQIVQEAMASTGIATGMPQGVQQGMPQGVQQAMPPAMPQEIITDTIAETGIAANDPQNIGMAQGGIVGYAVGGMMPDSTYGDYEKLLAELSSEGDILDDPYGPSSVEDVTENVTENVTKDARGNYSPFKSPIENVAFMPFSKNDPNAYVEELEKPGGELEAFGINYEGLNEKQNALLEKQRENLESGRRRMGPEAALRGFLNLASSDNPNFVQAASESATVGLDEYIAENERLDELDSLIDTSAIDYEKDDLTRAENERTTFKTEKKDRTDLQLKLLELYNDSLAKARDSGDEQRVKAAELTLKYFEQAGISQGDYKLNYKLYREDYKAIENAFYNNIIDPNNQKPIPMFRSGTAAAQELVEKIEISENKGPILKDGSMKKKGGVYTGPNGKPHYFDPSENDFIEFSPTLLNDIKRISGRNFAN